jgi:DNA-binding transcriptional LysR family regulator
LPTLNRRIHWDDLQYVLAVAAAGSLAAAADTLRVNRTTVLRRINSFERKHGVRIFERLPSGYVLTSAGDELLAAARGLENTIATLERKLAGQDHVPVGVVHLTTTDTLLTSVLAPALTAFHETHPGITLEVTTANTLLDLSRRDADVAIRPAMDPPDVLIGRRICAIAFAIYASPRYAAAHDSSRAQPQWIGPDETLSNTSVGRWMRSEVPDAHYAFRMDSLRAMRDMCVAGAGLAALPCYLGDTDARLTRVRSPIKEMTTALWILTHPDLVRAARVRLVSDFLVAALGAERDLFEGRRPRA